METLQALQRCELDILKAFVSVCDQLGLKYYLLGGTLLGAVRHQGFIPWDDDIDVGMLREDYERFMAEGQKLLPDCYFLQNHHTDPEWPANFAKIRDDRTTFIETSVKNQRIHHGVYMDVFPLDHYASGAAAAKFDLRNQLMVRRINQVFTAPATGVQVPQWKKCVVSVLNVLSRLRYPTVTAALDAREKLFCSMPQGGLIANHCGAWGKKEMVPADWYGEGAWLSFEGLTLRVPAQYDRWLSQVYGDYMQWPPVEKRVAHHYNEVTDLNRPYTDYCAEK